MDSVKIETPPGYHLYYRDEMFYNASGPMYVRRIAERLNFGFRVLEKHLNSANVCHGGMLVTIIDMQFGIAGAYEGGIDALPPTVNLTTDFTAPALPGQWVEAQSRIVKQTRRMMFLEGWLYADGEVVLRANAILKIPSKQAPEGYLDALPPLHTP